MTLEQMMKHHPEATLVDLHALVECASSPASRARTSADGTLTTMNTAQTARRNADVAPNRAKTCARFCHTTLTSSDGPESYYEQASDT